MEQYIVSARKYRPSSFKTVVGQKGLTTTLKNAIESERLAQAYLFCGPRGVGKTSCARIFAKTINCLSPTADGEACNECESCRALNEGRSFNIVELDAASNNSVDDIRKLNDQVRIPPQIGKYRVFIIDEVHMLSISAFNAFLKTLEEPPKYVVFILATTEKHKVIPTILSRCQIYDFNRITINDMVEHLKYVAEQEGISAEVEALDVIAQKADGAMRDALSIFDQVAASSMNNITYKSAIANLNVLDYEYYFRLVDAFLAGDVTEALLIYKEIRDAGFDSLFFVNGIGSHVRDLMVAADPRTISLLEVSDVVGQRYIEQAKRINVKWYYAAMEFCNTCDMNYRTATNKQFVVELTLIRLCQIVNGGIALSTGDSVQMAPVKKKSEQISAAPSSPSTVVTKSEAQIGAVEKTPAVQQPSQPRVEQQPTSEVTQRRVVAPSQVDTPQMKTVHIAPRISISKVGSLSGQDSSQGVERTQLRSKPIDEENLKELWYQFIYTHPDMKIVGNAMRMAMPISMGDNLYKVMVDNPAQKQAMESEMATIVQFLRDKLENDHFKIDVGVNEVQVRRIQRPEELLDDIMKKNKVIADVLRRYDAEIV